MAPKTTRLKRGSQSAAARAWDRSFQRFKDFGNRIFTSPDINLCLSDLQTAVDDLNVIKHRAGAEGPGAPPGVWQAFIESGDVACLVTLHNVVVRRSSTALSPDVSSNHRPLYATLRAKITGELVYMSETDPNNPCKRTLFGIAWALVASEVLRCYAALLLEAVRPLMSQYRGLQADPPPGQAVRLSPPRRAVQSLSELLNEAQQVLSFLHLAHLHSARTEPRWEQTGPQLGDELLGSGFLELWCQGLLLLASCEGCEREAAALIESFFPCLHGLRDFLCGMARLHQDHPSFNFLMSSHMVKLCAALDGGSMYGFPAAAAPWAAPLMVPFLPAAAATSRHHPVVPPLDFNSASGSALHMASLVMWSWALALLFQETALNVSSKTSLWESLQMRAARNSLGVTALPPPAAPRSLVEACQAFLNKQAHEATFVQLLMRMVDDDPCKVPPDLMEDMTLETFGEQLSDLCNDTAVGFKVAHDLVEAVTTPPVNAVAVMDVCLRLSAVVWEALLGLQHASRQRQQGEQRTWQLGAATLQLSRAAAPRLINDVLTTARTACRFVAALAVRTPVPQRAVLQMKDCWRECLAWAALKAGSRGVKAQEALTDWTWEMVAQTMALEGPAEQGTGVPDFAPPGVATAITAGYIPVLNLIFRHLLLKDKRQCAEYLPKLLLPNGRTPAWELLLAFGPSSDLMVLLSTLASLVNVIANDLPDTPEAAAAAVAAAKARLLGRMGMTEQQMPPEVRRLLLANWPLRDTAAAVISCAQCLLVCSHDHGLMRLWSESVTGVAQALAAAEAGSAASQGPGSGDLAGAAAGDVAGPSGCAGATEEQVGWDLHRTKSHLSTLAVTLLSAYVKLFRRMTLLANCGGLATHCGTLLSECPVLPWIPVLAARVASSVIDREFTRALGQPGSQSSAAAPEDMGAGTTSGDRSAAASDVVVATAASIDVPTRRPTRCWLGVLIQDLDVFGLLRDLLIGVAAPNSPTAGSLKFIQDALVALAVFLPEVTGAALGPGPGSPANAAAKKPPLGLTTPLETARRGRRTLPDRGGRAIEEAAAEHQPGGSVSSGGAQRQPSLWEVICKVFHRAGPYNNVPLLEFLKSARTSGAKFTAGKPRDKDTLDAFAANVSGCLMRQAVQAGLLTTARWTMWIQSASLLIAEI